MTEANEVFTWPAAREFDTWWEAYEWAYYQRRAEGPKYLVRRMREGVWEAIQEWMRSF